MAIRSVCAAHTVEHPEEDRKAAYRAEQFRVGREAIYFAAFPGTKYLPFSALERAWIQNSSLALTASCGKALPITVLRVRYAGGFYQTFSFEKRTMAERVLQSIAAARPDISLEPEPRTKIE